MKTFVSKNTFLKMAYLLFAIASPVAVSQVAFVQHPSANVGIEPNSIAVNDVNSDGKLDVGVLNTGAGDETLSILLGNGNGTLQPQTKPVSVSSCFFSDFLASGDYNYDGKPDFVAGCGNAIMVRNNGDGTFGNGAYGMGGVVTSVLINHFNQDEKPDIATANYDTNTVGVRLNVDGDGFYQLITYSAGHRPNNIKSGDFNNDGYQDIVSVNLGSMYDFPQPPTPIPPTLSVFLNNGDGTFQPQVSYSIGAIFMGFPMVADFNGDNYPDIAGFYGWNPDLLLYINKADGSGEFHPPTSQSIGGWGAGIAADINRDGNMDIALHTGQNSIGVLLGKGDGTFKPRINRPITVFSSRLAAGDFDNDSRPDLAIMTNMGSNEIGMVTLLINDQLFYGDFEE